MHVGPTSMSMNVHQLRHLVYHVKNFGPLWVYSCFSFESRNGDLKRLFHGTKNMSNQVLDIIYLYGQLSSICYIGSIYIKQQVNIHTREPRLELIHISSLSQVMIKFSMPVCCTS